MAKKKIEVEVVVDDKGTTKKVALSQKQLSDALEKSGKSTDRATKRQRGLIETANSGGKNFANLASSISGGIVPAYAVLAAQVFAVTAAFQFLQEAANVRNLISAQEEYGAVTGIAFSRITKSLQEATDGQLRFQEAAQATAIGTAAGLSGDQLERLATTAKNASFALGRDLTDSFNRLVRGVTKAEPELLDELGIILRLKPATEEYAASIGKTADQLNAFERSQAVANFTIAEGERKFGMIGQVIDEEALAVQKFMKSFDDLSITIKSAIVDVLNPVLAFLSKNTLALTGVLSIFAAPLVKSIIPSFDEFGKSAKKASRLARKGLSSATEEVTKAKKASEDLVLSQEKAIGKANDLAKTGGVSKLGEGKKGGKGALDFLSGASDSKAAERQAKRVLDGAQKALDKDGIVRRGKLRNFNKQELADLQKSYKLRVRASSMATKQIAGKWQILAAKQKVLAAKTSLVWRKAFVQIGRAGAKAPKLIDKAFRAASFLGLALLFFDLGKAAFDFFFPTSKAAEKLNEEFEESTAKLEDLNKHLEKTAEYKFKNVLDINESVAQLGNAVQEANIPDFIKDIDRLANAEDKSSEAFLNNKKAVLAVAKSLTQLDSSYQPLVNAIEKGESLTEAQAKGIRKLSVDSVAAVASLNALREAQKEARLELSRVVQGIPKAPLENLVLVYRRIVTAARDSIPAQNKAYMENIRVAEKQKKAAEAYIATQRSMNRSKFDAATDPNDPQYMSDISVKIREQMQLRDDMVKKIQEEGEMMTNISKQFGIANATSIMLEVSMAKQLQLASGIQGISLAQSFINKSSMDFESRRTRLFATQLPLIQGILQARQNEESAQAALNAALIESGGLESQGVKNARTQLGIARIGVTIAEQNLERQVEVNAVKNAELTIEERKLEILKETNKIMAARKAGDISSKFMTEGAGAIGRSVGDVNRDKRQAAVISLQAKAEMDLNNIRLAGLDLEKARKSNDEGAIERARQKVVLASLAFSQTQADIINAKNAIPKALDEVRIAREKQETLASIISLNPIQREMEEFLISKGIERRDLSFAQIEALEEQVRLQQQQKIIVSGLSSIQGAFQSGIENAVMNLTGGIRTLKQSFLDLGQAVVQELNRMIARMIALQVASAFMSGFSPFSTAAGADKAMQGTGQLQGLPEMAPGASNVGRYGGIFKPYRTGGIARGRNAGYPAILHGTEAVVPLGQGKSAIPVEFTGRGGQNQNNVTVNVSMASDGTAQTQTQTSGEDQGKFGKAIAMAVQQEIHNQKRPGGMLSPYGAGSG